MSLRAEGFRGICNPISIDFHTNTTFISGRNGTGKTSILGSIEWVLFGELKHQPRENATNDELVNITRAAQTATVTLVLEGDGARLEVSRSKRAGKRDTPLRVKLPTGRELEGREAQAALNQSLGLNFDDFYRAVFLHQESVRGLLTDDPRIRNESLDRLFGVETLRDLLGALSASTKPVRDALTKLERSKDSAFARLSGALEQVEKQRTDAKEDAARRGIPETDLTIEVVIKSAASVISDIGRLAKEAGVTLKDLVTPQESDAIDGFSRGVSAAIRTLRNAATEAALTASGAQGAAELDRAQLALQTALARLANADEQFNVLRTEIGDPASFESFKEAAELELHDAEQLEERVGAAQRIFQDSFELLQATPDASECPACGRPMDRDELIAHIQERLSGELQTQLDASRDTQRQLRKKIGDLSASITLRNRIIEEQGQASEEVRATRNDARALLGSTSADVGPASLDEDLSRDLQAKKEDLLERASLATAARAELEKRVDAIQTKMERLREISRFLKLDESCKQASSQLGAPDDESNEIAQELGALSDLEDGLGSIADVISREAGGRAKAGVGSAHEDIAHLYGELCGHPYFDSLRITVDTKVLSGVERNDYIIRARSSSDDRETLASSRLSTGQMNCVALSVYLALATQLQHNLGFVILDDPSQNLDSDHKAALVRILARLAKRLQIVIGTEDTELDELLTQETALDGQVRHSLTSWSAVSGTALRTDDD